MDIDKNKRYIDLIGDTSTEYTLSEEEYQFFCEQSLAVYICTKSNICMSFSDDIRNKHMLIAGMHYEQTLYEISEIAKCLNDSNIDYRFMKGVGIALTYTIPYSRVMGDIDLLIKKESHYEASLILEKLGYKTDFYDATTKDIRYFKNNSLVIELHRSLNSDTEFMQLPDIEESIWSEVHIHRINDVPVCMPSPLVHYKYQVFHLIKHFCSRGSGLRFLLDLKYFSRFYNIDRDELIPYFQKYGYDQFYRNLLTLMTMSFEAESNDTSMQEKKSILLANQVVAYMLENGVYGNDDTASKANYRYYYYARIAKKSIFRTIQIMLFPSGSQLGKQFLYAKTHTWLLPIAWIHRIINAIFGKKFSMNEKMFLFKKGKNIVSKKFELLTELGLKDYIQREE